MTVPDNGPNNSLTYMHVALVTARVRYLDAPSELKVRASVAAGLFGHGATYARVDMTEGPQGPVFMEAELIEPQLFFAARREAASDLVTNLERAPTVNGSATGSCRGATPRTTARCSVSGMRAK